MGKSQVNSTLITMTKVAITTVGCKVNQFESEALHTSLVERGYEVVSFGEGADISIINTCTVTHRADFQSRQLVRKALRLNPKSLLVVTGCYSQVEPEVFLKMEGVRYILGNKEKDHLPDLLPLMEKGEIPKILVSNIGEETSFSTSLPHSFFHHTRAFLKIQDGCNGQCSYCIVPRARGPSRSLSPEKIFEQMRILKEKGFKEVVLTGVHLGCYGVDLNPPFSLQRLLESIEGMETPDRIRLSSIEPKDFSSSLISTLSQSKKICPHFHIPIQSGDDEILKRMNRDYDRSFLIDLIQGLKEKISEASIGVDLIIGFPGETEERFERTYQLIDSLPISYLHVFPFSKRKGTPAARLSPQLPESRIKERTDLIRRLGREKRKAFNRQFLNKELDVLVEDRRDKETGKWVGISRNYIPVLLDLRLRDPMAPTWVNQELKIWITGESTKGLIGTVREHG